MDRQAWLERRRQGLGSSDAAAVCGLSRWGNPLSVYLDKLGVLPQESRPEMEWGLRLEPVIAAAYTERTGQRLTTVPLAWSVAHPFLLASVDRRWILAENPVVTHVGRIVELKTTRSAEGWGDEGTDQVPPDYLIQVQHQMAVLGEVCADVAVLIGGSDFRIYTVPRNEAVVEQLVAIEGRFWSRFLAREAPAPDWSDPETPRLVELLHRPRGGVTVDLEGEAQHWVEAYETLGAETRALEKSRRQAKARLCELMGEAETGRLPDGRAIRRKKVTVGPKTVDGYEFFDFRILKGDKRGVGTQATGSGDGRSADGAPAGPALARGGPGDAADAHELLDGGERAEAPFAP